MFEISEPLMYGLPDKTRYVVPPTYSNLNGYIKILTTLIMETHYHMELRELSANIIINNKTHLKIS